MTFEKRFSVNRANRENTFCCGDVTSMLVSATSAAAAAAALRRDSLPIELIEKRFCWGGEV